jgi:hypothetical protein
LVGAAIWRDGLGVFEERYFATGGEVIAELGRFFLTLAISRWVRGLLA